MGINKKNVGLRIRSIRKDKGMTLDDFGDLLTPPASDSIVSRWERGISLPSNERNKQIAKEGNISVDELLYGKIDDYLILNLNEIADRVGVDSNIISLSDPAKLVSTINKIIENNISPIDNDSLKHYLSLLIDETKDDLENELMHLIAKIRSNPLYAQNVFKFVQENSYRETDKKEFGKYSTHNDFVNDLIKKPLEENIENMDFIRRYANAYETLKNEVTDSLLKKHTAYLIDFNNIDDDQPDFNYYDFISKLSSNEKISEFKQSQIDFFYKSTNESIYNVKKCIAFYEDINKTIHVCGVFNKDEVPILDDYPYQIIYDNTLYVQTLNSNLVKIKGKEVSVDDLQFLAPILSTYY